LKLARESDPKSERVFNLQQRINTLKSQKDRLAKRMSDKTQKDKQDKENEKTRTEASTCEHCGEQAAVVVFSDDTWHRSDCPVRHRFEVNSAFADIRMVRGFLNMLGFIQKHITRDDEDYVVVEVVKDKGEKEVVNILTNALQSKPQRLGKEYGPLAFRINKTVQWAWDVPGKGQVVFFPPTSKIAFRNK
jgi:hypothetical protein